MLKTANAKSLATILPTNSRLPQKKASSRSWMIEFGIRRFLVPKDKCPRCNMVRYRIYRRHPFVVPANYGKGSWLWQDCACVFEELKKKREKLKEITATPLDEPLPLGLRQHSFSNFKVGAYNQEAYQVCEKYTKRFAQIADGKGILLFGKSGTGKTHLACAIANELKEKYRVYFAHVPSFLERARQGGADHESLIHADLLVLDDIGSERETDWALEKLLIIVEGRLNFLRSTVYTTNYDLGDLEKRIGMRISSRILGNNVAVLVSGPDWRIRNCIG